MDSAVLCGAERKRTRGLRHGELRERRARNGNEIRKKLIETGGVDVIITLSSNFFYTVTLPATLWFFDRAKETSDRKDKVLFIDARNIFRQVDRAHRDFTPDQIEYIANIVRLYRGQPPENLHGGEKLLQEHFPSAKYGTSQVSASWRP